MMLWQLQLTAFGLVVYVAGVVTFTCQRGHFFHPRKQICFACRTCPVGQSKLKECSHMEDTLCGYCPKHQFSYKGTCRNCTTCASATIRGCNTTSDAVCKHAEKDEDDSNVPLGAIVGIVCGVFLFIVISIVCYKKRRSHRHNANDAKDGNLNEENDNMVDNQAQIERGAESYELINRTADQVPSQGKGNV